MCATTTYRLSFLSASFVTLTNLVRMTGSASPSKPDPLFVSIHATEPAVRRACLGQTTDTDIIAKLRRTGSPALEVHGQVGASPLAERWGSPRADDR